MGFVLLLAYQFTSFPYLQFVCMMAYSSSCESSNLAPSEFDLANSLESSSGLTVAIERCPLCDGSKRSVYCRDCVNGGYFMHSKGSHPER